MNNLIEIQVNENQEQTISGRELHMQNEFYNFKY